MKKSSQDITLAISFDVNYPQDIVFNDFGRKGEILPEKLLENLCQ